MKTLGPLLTCALLLASCKPGEPPAVPDPSTGTAAAPHSLPEIVSFNRHIQPILSENCYHCHGPDSGTREPKSEPLRLDDAAQALAARDGAAPVIIPGQPAASSLIKLIRSTDPDEIMPPPSSHKSLSAREIALLERWIEQGAEYQPHWSFIPPAESSVPDGTHAVDHFVRQRLLTENLQPNPPENPSRFLRRLHFDLTGLPPSSGFAESATSEPLETIVDQLLATPAAAEHQARIWLDAARYADTHGIHIDNYRAVWPYRDWVIDAFAKNMPWDRFTIEQIAGDLLPDATLEQKIATGFNRCLPTTGEGGAIAEEYEAIYAKDRVETVSTIWLGLTTGCAACHDHKFDPIPMADFYRFAAFFRNNTMKAMDANEAHHPPNVFAPLPADRDHWTALEKEIAGIQAALADRKSNAGPDFQAWLSTAAIGLETPQDPTLAVHIPFDTSEPVSHGMVDGKPVQWNLSGQHREGPLGPAILANSITSDLGNIAGFSRDEKITLTTHLYVEGKPSGAVIARMDPADHHRGWDLWLENGHIGTHIIDRWPDAANKVVAPSPLEPGKWHHVAIAFDGSQASHRTISLFVNGEPVKRGPTPNTLDRNIVTTTPLRIGSRKDGANRLNGTVAIQDFRFYRRLLSPEEIAGISRQSQLQHFLSIPEGERKPEQTAALFEHYLQTADAPTRDLRKKLSPLLSGQSELRERGSITLVMEEKPDSAASTHILERGVYTAKGELVPANTLSSLPPLTGDGPHDRLDLAKWLVDRDNPLTARVTVNRIWQQLFGTGLVESSDDFGIMGAQPSHPELLDWLAVEFMDSGWNFRHILKLIVTSETYRQSAVISPEKLERDPYNRLLGRGPRNRLDAEVLRDTALAASQLLSPKIGGPPVKPYQPEGIWEAVAMPQSNTRSYSEDTGENLYRRSIYTFWKRTAPPPAMEILNAPSREVACVRRDATNTPLQALVLLNDPQFVEASRQLASHAIAASDHPDTRIDHITTRLLNRVLDAPERKIIHHTLAEISTSFSANPEAATALVNTGATPPDSSRPAPELAAWTLIVSQLLNLDETLTR